MRLLMAALLCAGCVGTGDGTSRQLAIGFDPRARPIAVGIELELAVEKPLERGHFCVGHCALDGKLETIRLTRVTSTRPEVVEVVSHEVSGRAPLVRLRTRAPGAAALVVEAEAGGHPMALRDEWPLEALPLASIEASSTRLPEGARLSVELRPVAADGRELYVGRVESRAWGAVRLTEDRRMAVELETQSPGQALLEIRAATRTQMIPLEIGVTSVAAR